MSDKTTGWRPIETAPKDGQCILLWNGSVHVGEWDYGEWSHDDGTNIDVIWDTTHWMPLPEPPQGVMNDDR